MNHCLTKVICTVILMSQCAFATVQYGAVNHITKQVAILETGNIYTPLFWKSLSEQQCQDIINYADDIGYSYTDFPFMIELIP